MSIPDTPCMDYINANIGVVPGGQWDGIYGTYGVSDIYIYIAQAVCTSSRLVLACQSRDLSPPPVSEEPKARFLCLQSQAD